MFTYTNDELQSVFDTCFESREPLILKQFPAKEKKKYLVLLWIKDIFIKDVMYTESDVNTLLKPIYHDYVTLRRYLIDYQFLMRKRDGSVYMKTEN
ncbi:MAG: DUF2087 domain-containing protein [Acholeplasmataceae bacterium]